MLTGTAEGVDGVLILRDAGRPETLARGGAVCTEELMIRVQMGDMAAYRELVRPYQSKVFRVVRSFHRNPEDAMEVCQDTFMKLFIARHTWERRTSFSAWLYRIAINAAIDRYRRGDKGRTTSLEDVAEGQIESSAAARPAQDPAELLDAAQRRRILEGAIRRLPSRQREVVSLRYFGELTLEEISSALRCPLGTVKSNLHKGVMALKRMLFEQKDVLGYE